MKIGVLSALALCQFFVINGQNSVNDQQFGVTFSGYVKTDIFYDTRQTISPREGHFLLWPSPEKLDATGKDINDQSSFNILSIQSRLSANVKGPDAFGAQTTGLLEGDFFGQLEDNINLFRLRHAFVALKWQTTELTVGQTWNPFFVVGCFPGTVSFSTGTPFESFSRNPQVRLTKYLGQFNLMGALLSQRDYTGYDANNKASYKPLSNSGIPDIHLQVHYSSIDNNILVGGGAAYKQIVPRLTSTVGGAEYVVNETVVGISAMAYTTIKTKPITAKFQGRYGENISDLVTIGGYAVKSISNTTTGESKYTPLRSISLWSDIQTNGKRFQVGVFGGYLKSLGTKSEMSAASNAIFGMGNDIASMWRISPRAVVNSNKVRVALELEYTTANYGIEFDAKHIASSFKSVSNLRTLLSVYYFF